MTASGDFDLGDLHGKVGVYKVMISARRHISLWLGDFDFVDSQSHNPDS